MVDNLLPICVWYPREQFTESRIGLQINFFLSRRDRFRCAVACMMQQVMAIAKSSLRFLNDSFPDMVSNTGGMQG